jgi:hypothetical protein
MAPFQRAGAATGQMHLPAHARGGQLLIDAGIVHIRSNIG